MSTVLDPALADAFASLPDETKLALINGDEAAAEALKVAYLTEKRSWGKVANRADRRAAAKAARR